ncbi:PA2778 family cysteine peptidase [Ideonella livida]|uniref:PA2778 family cysteine peptidase n=1 Tax=Ideonella livida TaxID=2707176 RepID=A0A7C9TKC2_9BURK|nr:PA2778 family cysteine peptidase [Ideonella livida]NDY92640.1 PA2778 family cysteine peptidase [Ideonella livida]
MPTPRQPLTRRACLGRLRRWGGLGALPLIGGLGGGLAGCAPLSRTLTPPLTQALQRDPEAARPTRAEVRDVPFVAQGDLLCGPASLAMLLGHAGQPAPLSRLTARTYLPGRQGSLQAEMLATLRREGLLAGRLRPAPHALSDALDELAHGQPVAVLLNLSLSWWTRWHYAVLTGYDLQAQTVRLHSGDTPDAHWPLSTLEHTWARSGHWALRACRPGTLPRHTEPERLLADVLGLEQALGSEAPAVLQAWAAAQERHPDVASFWLGWGNALAARQDWPAAAQAFKGLVARQDSAVAWNNLAWCHLQAGELEAAEQALSRAQQRLAGEPHWAAAVADTQRALELARPTPAGAARGPAVAR